PGMRLAPLPLPPLRPAGVVRDRQLYRAGRDAVHLLAFRLGRPGEDGELLLRGPGTKSTLPVRSDRHGLVTLPLRDLAPGDYEVGWADQPDEACATFTVAEYRLAPLVVDRLDRHQPEARARLRVRLGLESFGLPVEGGVWLALNEPGRRGKRVEAEARNGRVEAELPLEGEGQLALEAVLRDDPSRTATLPLPGS